MQSSGDSILMFLSETGKISVNVILLDLLDIFLHSKNKIDYTRRPAGALAGF